MDIEAYRIIATAIFILCLSLGISIIIFIVNLPEILHGKTNKNGSDVSRMQLSDHPRDNYYYSYTSNTVDPNAVEPKSDPPQN